jgi:hypothetical protein
MGPKGEPDTKTNWSTGRLPSDKPNSTLLNSSLYRTAVRTSDDSIRRRLCWQLKDYRTKLCSYSTTRFRALINSVDIATRLRPEQPRNRGCISSRGNIFSRLHRPWGPPSHQSNGYRGLFPRGVKRPGREVDHSLSSTRV